MATTLDRVAEDIRERAKQVRAELAEREHAYRPETQPLRDELVRLDAAVQAIGGHPPAAERPTAGTPARRAPRGQNKTKSWR